MFPIRSCRPLLLALGALGLVPGIRSEEEPPRREAAELRPRAGLPNFLRKARSGEGEVRVAYLGGSITAAPGWRVKSLEGFRTRFPGVKWTEINAAIGGTGSDLGVFRHPQDVLVHRPDLLFVEFAVNDGGAEPARIQRGMEGIVRQTWAADPETDIVFVYTLSEPFLAELQSGKASRAASAMEEVADHYGIPSIHLGVEVARQVGEGKLVFKGALPDKNAKSDPASPPIFSTDGVHPLIDTGHEIYARVISRSCDQLERGEAGTRPHSPGDPLRPDHWAAARMVPLRQSMLSGKWERLDSASDDLAKRFARQVPQLWRTESPGASLTFRFRGQIAGFFDVVGPDGGQLRVRLDDKPERTVPRIDAHCTYHRLSQFLAGSGLESGALHTVHVTLDSAAPDKRSILFERNRPDLEANPAKYAPNRWNVGAILLLGEEAE